MGTATISNLIVRMSGETALLETGFAKGAALTQGFSGAVEGAGAALLSLSTAGIAAAVAGIAILAKGQFDEIDALGKMSDKTGIASDKLAGFELACKLSNTSTEDLQTAVIKLERNMGEIAAGGGSAAATALQDLGLSFDTLKSKTPDEQFQAVIGALENMHDQSRKVADGMALLGKGAVSTFTLTADGLKEGIELSKEFGTALSRDQIKSVEAINDKFTLVWERIKGIVQTLIVALAPILEVILDILNEIGIVITFVFDLVGKVVSFVASIVTGIASVVKSVLGVSKAAAATPAKIPEFKIPDEAVQKGNKQQFASLAERGSQEAFKVAIASGGVADPLPKIAAATEKQLTEAERHTKLLEKIAAKNAPQIVFPANL